MKALLKIVFIFMAAIASAKAALPVGTFGHGFTKVNGEPVWSIQAHATGYKLLGHGDGNIRSAHILTSAERKIFWSQMAWSSGSYQNAECIGVASELICYVPPQARQSIPALQSHSSDFFHYDKTGGIIEAKFLRTGKIK